MRPRSGDWAASCDLVPRRRFEPSGVVPARPKGETPLSVTEFTRPPPPLPSPLNTSTRSGSVRPSSSKEREEAAHHRAAKDVSFEPRAAVARILVTPSARSAGSLLPDVCCASSSLCQPKKSVPGARWRRLEDVEHGQAPARRRLAAFLHVCSGTSWSAARWLAAQFRVQVRALPQHIMNRLQEKQVERRGADTVALREAPLVLVEAIRALEMYVCRKSSEYPLLAAFGWQCLVKLWASMRFDDALHTTPSSIELRGDGFLACVCQSKVDRRRRGSRFIVPRFGLLKKTGLDLGLMPGEAQSPRSTSSQTTGLTTWLTSTSLQASRQLLPSSCR